MTELGRAALAFPSVLRVSFAGALSYRSELVIEILTQNLSLVMMVFWWAVAREGPVGSFDQQQFTAYFLAAAAVRMLTAMWLPYEMNLEIRQGLISKRLLRPIHPFLTYAGEAMATLPIRCLVLVPIALLMASFVGPQRLAHDPVLWMVTPLAVAGAWMMTLAVSLLIGGLGLWWDSSIACWDLWLGLSALLSGYLLPVQLLPDWLAPILRFTPFPYLLAFPIDTMLGLIDRQAALGQLAWQWGYASLFLAAALLCWRGGVARFEAYGG